MYEISHKKQNITAHWLLKMFNIYKIYSCTTIFELLRLLTERPKIRAHRFYDCAHTGGVQLRHLATHIVLYFLFMFANQYSY